jgi:hypothetical protein
VKSSVLVMVVMLYPNYSTRAVIVSLHACSESKDEFGILVSPLTPRLGTESCGFSPVGISPQSPGNSVTHFEIEGAQRLLLGSLSMPEIVITLPS